MKIDRSIEFTVDHVSVVNRIESRLAPLLCVPSECSEPCGISITISVAVPRRNIARSWNAVPDRCFPVLRVLILAPGKCRTGKSNQPKTNKEEPHHYGKDTNQRRRPSKNSKSRNPALFGPFLFLLRAREPLCFFAACRAFLNVVSALAVSHKISILTLPAPVPSCFARAPENIPLNVPAGSVILCQSPAGYSLQMLAGRSPSAQ